MAYAEGASKAVLPAIKKHASRITPRTCLWPLAGSLVTTFGLSIGLTFRSDHWCYASTCGESLFPLQARLHVIVWYFWLSISVTFLSVRAFHPEMQKALARPLATRKLPVIRRHVSIGFLIMFFWVISLYGIAIGVWWVPLRDYFNHRNDVAGIAVGSSRLAAIAQTGHLCDITMGMVLLPISRHSALASFFQLSASTTLTNHTLTAYTLFVLVIIHGCLYVSWVPAFNSLSVQLRMVIPVLNPTYLHTQVWPGDTSSIGIWRASMIFSGSCAALVMCAIAITTLPKVRRANFNLFYFTHLLAILMVIVICLHASTLFYCTAPGLAMWFLDWMMRLWELRMSLNGSICTLGKGWYCVTLPLPRQRLSGCSCRSPIAHFYIHHADSSLRELHPFTTVTHLASQNNATDASEDDFPIQFLFRKHGGKGPSSTAVVPLPLYKRILRGKEKRKQSTQWTGRLAALVDEQQPELSKRQSDSNIDMERSLAPFTPVAGGINVALRLEGPYFTPADPYRYDTVVCLVAGTGVTGAISIAAAFNYAATIDSNKFSREVSPLRKWRRCIILWSVKESEDIDLPFLEPKAEGLELRKCLTGPGRSRVDLGQALSEICVKERREGGCSWVYISGPDKYVHSGREACQEVQRHTELDFYAAG